MNANHQSGGASTAPRKMALSPEEALGINENAGKNLLLACAASTVLTIAALSVMTVVPYLTEKSGGAAANVTPAKAEETPAPVEQPKPDPNATAGKKPTGQDTSKPPVGSTNILDKLGETGTKTGSPKVNPLDKADDLLKDLK